MSNSINPLAGVTEASVEGFDWETEGGYSKDERQKLVNLYEETLTEVNENEIIKGKVVSFDDRVAIVNIGFKSEGVVPITEFRDMDELEVGTEVEVYLRTMEDASGQMQLSRRLAKAIKTWNSINDAFEKDGILTGIVKRRTKGGFVVELDGVEAFLPGSQIDVKPVRDYDTYVGKSMDFKVVKINQQQHNVVISHKALIEKDIQQQRQVILNNLERGQVLEGVVKNVTTFGAFIDLGGVDGLLHITDISWGRINHPEEALNVDDKLNVVVLDFDDEKKRISLGLKQLQAHPWESLSDTIVEGSPVSGKIVTIADYGIFVEVVPGVEGLVHVSEMSWSSHPKIPNEMFEVGQEIDAQVLAIDREERKMSLGIKQLKEDPWDSVILKFPIGTQTKGTVRNLTNFGAFVELEEGVDGLIHIQDLSWMKKINHPSEMLEVGQELDVVVLELDLENRKLRLGHKQLSEDPWEKLETVFPVASLHKGTVLKLGPKGAPVELEYGLEGFVPKKHLQVEAGKPEVQEGDTIDLEVIEFNKEQKKIFLSHTKTWKADMASDTGAKKKPRAKTGGTASSGDGPKSTLGDLDSLLALKAEMEEQEK